MVANLPKPVEEAALTAEQAAIGQAVFDEGDVSAVVPISASKDRSAIAFQVLPEGDPTASRPPTSSIICVN